jgi:sugar lactone lactonase YvrE
VNHEWGTGGHSGQHATEIFPQAMRWLWKDWPAPVKAGAGSQILKDLLIPGEEWTLVADGYRFTEGPAANTHGEVFFNDIPNSKTYKISLDGKVTPFVADSGRANGQAVGPDGRLYAVATGKQQVLAYDESGKPTVIAEGIRGNDLAIRHDGGMYVTQPGAGENANVVWFVSATGEKKIVDRGLKAPNGIVLSPDQSLLYVADYASHWVYSYQTQPDGLLTYKQKFFRMHAPDTADDAGLDGIRVDREGRLYATSRMGIQVCDQAGRVNAIIPTPNGKVANVCFGGPDFKTLFATCSDRVYRRKMKVEGLHPDQAPFKPTPPRL